MKIIADKGCFLTESENVTLDKRTYRDMVIVTPEEVSKWKQISIEEKTAMEAKAALFVNKDMTADYLASVRTLIAGVKNSINDVPLSDEEVLQNAELYPTFDESIGQPVNQGYKFSCDGSMYEVSIPHTISVEMRPVQTPVMLMATSTETTENKINYYRLITQ